MNQSDDQDRTRLQPRRGGKARPAPDRSPVTAPSDQVTEHAGSSANVSPGNDIKTLVNDEVESITPSTGTSLSRRVRGHNTGVHPNDVLKNRFILERVLGAGGMGVVYKAKDLLKVEAKDRDPYVAIKVLGEEFKSHPEAFIALQRESRKTQRIAHPNIVNVHDFDKDGDTVFMTMEYLEGTPLDKLIKKYRSTGLPRPDVWRILEGFCSALSYAHQQNIIHSDLKPGNIFVTQNATAKVFDFGIARAVAKAEAGETTEPEDRTVFDAGKLGALTPTYASPEMLENEPPDVRDDIYALGCIAYEMFTGQHPFKRKNARDAWRRGMRPARIEGLTKQQWKAIEAALAFEREDRIGTVQEFWTQLTKKYSRPYAAWGVLILAAAIGGAALVPYFKPAPPPAPQFSEDDFRSEIETKIRVEMVLSKIQELLEVPSFDERWESSLWEELQQLAQLEGENAQPLMDLYDRIYALYVNQIRSDIEAHQFEVAAKHIETASRYTADATELNALQSDIDSRVAEIERERQQQLAQQREAAKAKAQANAQLKAQREQQQAFDDAMATLNSQLSCRSLPNMDDLNITITQLRKLDADRYVQQQPAVVQKLASCIESAGRNAPEKALALRDQALTAFPNSTLLQGIEIKKNDPCKATLAGYGARGRRTRCQDELASGGRSPVMVIIPGQGGVAPFALGRYEVTREEFDRFCQATGACDSKSSGQADLPITNVPHAQVEEYLSWLSQQTGRQFRLPTLEEWSHAAAGRSGALDSNRNCELNSRGIQKGGALVNASIGQQNDWGLVNHVGNAAEWVSSSSRELVAAGGSYATDMSDCDLNTRQNSSGRADREIGFRVARDLDS